MGASFSAEIHKLVRRPATWVLLGIWALLNLSFGLVIPDLVYTYSHNLSASDHHDIEASLSPSGFLGNAVGGLPLLGGAILLIAGAMIFGAEFGWGTYPINFIRRPGRLSVLGGYF